MLQDWASAQHHSVIKVHGLLFSRCFTLPLPSYSPLPARPHTLRALHWQGLATPVEYLTPLGAVSRVMTGSPQIINGGRFFDKEGARVQPSSGGSRFNSAGTRLLYDFAEDKY